MIRLNTFKMADGCGEDTSVKKNQNWSFYEAKCLVEVWADEEIQRQLAAMGRKQNIWENIAAKLNENGFKRTASQCKTKIHNLEQKYKKAKNLNNTSGQARNTCLFFEELDAVLGTKPSIAPKLILEASAVASGEYSQCMDGEGVEDENITGASAKAQTAATPAADGEKDEFSVDEGPSTSGQASAATTDPRSGKVNKGKKRKAPKAADKMESFFDKFCTLQQESEKRFLEAEERRARHEAEQDAKRMKHEAEQDEKREQFLLSIMQTLARSASGHGKQ